MKPGIRWHNARYMRDYSDAAGFVARLADWLAEREYSVLSPLTFYTPPSTTYFIVIFIPH